MKRERAIAYFVICALLALALVIGRPGSFVIKDASCGEVNYTASGLRDPFENQLPRVKPKEEGKLTSTGGSEELAKVNLPALSVESMISGGPVPQAIIKGRIRRVGDDVEGALITKITKDGVELLYQGNTFLVPAPSRTMGHSQGGQDAK